MRARNVRRAAALAAGALALPFLAACGASVQEFSVGECLDLSDAQGEVSEVPVVDCSDEHDGEVFYIHNFDGDDYPGVQAVSEELQQACVDNFEAYIGAPYETSEVYVNVLHPTEDSWDRADDRSGICIAQIPGQTLTESLENHGA
jgi:hypothetical protein